MTTGTPNAGTSNDSTGNTPPKKKPGWPKGRKRRLLPKDGSAPKGPLSGYMLFMNEQRESVKQENVKAGFPEISKIMAQKWAQLESQDRQKYLELAEADKERYNQEMGEYKKTDAYKNFLKEQQKEISNMAAAAKKPKKETAPPPPPPSPAPVVPPVVVPPAEVISNGNSILEIPIFTEEFLNHNKVREGELRQLRKSNTDYEEQNAILQKHIESMRTAVEKLEKETKQLETNNETLKEHLTSLKSNLKGAFAAIPVPGTNEMPTETNIENYISNMVTALSSNPQQHSKLAQSVKNVVNNLPQ